MGLNLEFPFYFDQDSILLGDLGVTPYQTPLSLLLTRDGKIIAIDKAIEFSKERTTGFKDFFLALISKEE